MEEKELTDIDKLRYIQKFLKTGEGDKDLVMQYAQDVGKNLDDFQAKVSGFNPQCRGIPTIPGP